MKRIANESSKTEIPKVLTVKKASEASGLNQRRIYRACEDGTLAHARFGKSIYVKMSDLQDYINRHICDVQKLSKRIAVSA